MHKLKILKNKLPKYVSVGENNNEMEIGLILIVLKALSIIPLVFYPFLLLANLMSFCGHRSGDESIYQMLIVQWFGKEKFHLVVKR